MTSTVRAAVAALACMAGAAQAFPIAKPGTEGLAVAVAATGDVFATYEGNSASYSNDLLLDGLKIFNNHATPIGTTVNLGSFAAGTVLTFELFVTNTNTSYFSGAASANPDGKAHARVEGDWKPGTTLVSFEDLYNGPFEYNDLSFSFSNTVAAVPEPATVAMWLAGLAAIGAIARHRKT